MSQFFILLDENRRQNAIEFIKSLNIGRLMSVEVKTYRKSRSNSQNRTYWMWLGIIGETLGYDTDELHEVFKVRLLGTEKKFVFGETVDVAKSTSKLTTKEFADYMTKIEMLAAEMSIRLPHPDDYRYALMLDNAA